MDFNALISMAQKNGTNKQATQCYQTKYLPQKKQTKQSKTLSENIKKFLARQEEEKKQKALEEQKKKESLLALRDRKAQSRINKHLKVCKSANKSVLADAIDNENTAITIAGPSQPDEDDYGYVSQEAAALYDHIVNKYNKIPEKPLYSNTEKRTVNDIASTKDRLKQAFKQQELGESDGQRRKKKSSALNVKEHEIVEKVETEKVKEEDKEEKPKSKKKPVSTPIDFVALLKLAEKKQHEPVVVEVKPKVEDERPMTKRQQQEYFRERERKEHREKSSDTNKKSNVTSSKPPKVQSNKVLGINEKSTSNPIPTKNIPKIPLAIPKKVTNKTIDKSSSEKSDLSKISVKNELLEERKKLEAERKQLEEMRRAIEEEKKKLEESQSKQVEAKSQMKSDKVVNKPKITDKQISSKNVKPRQFSPADLKMHSSLVSNKPKQFPSPDVRLLKPKPNLKRPLASKRRIYDEDEEYDSDMNDFIDDGVEEDCTDYSKHISEIFGYDRSKYRHMDEEDDTAMESNFAQQLKEEYVSTKIGIMEDLEDMRMEAMQKKKKLLNKK